MLSLGNMYFANLSSNPERYIKDSYKFFHHVLTKDPKNVYAANGLGVVCAEKGEFDVAREIISRVSTSFDNVSTFYLLSNLDTTFMSHHIASSHHVTSHYISY
jgi:hypothetical protein